MQFEFQRWRAENVVFSIIQIAYEKSQLRNKFILVHNRS